MATDNLMPQSSTSVIKHFMLRDSTTGQGLTGKVHSDFTGKYNIAGGAEVTLSFSSGTAGDAYSSGKIVPLGLGKYAWHVPNAVFASLGNVSAVLSATGGIDVHCEWLIVADSRDVVTKPVNVTQFGGANGTFASGVPEVKVASMAADSLNAAAISADAGAELAALVETYIVNEGDATAVMQAIADKIAADWVAGDASPLAIASAVWANATRTITGGSLTTAPPTAAAIASEVFDTLTTHPVLEDSYGELFLDIAASGSATQTKVTQIVNALPTSGHLAGSADSGGAAVLDSAGRTAIAAAVDVKLTAEHGAGSWAGGGSGGGDNTEVLEAIDSMKSIISEWIALNIPTDVRGFPATIIGGTDIEVPIEIVDSNDDPITEIFGESVESVQWLFGMGTSARRARILGSVEWTSDDLLLISMAKADTLSEDDGPRTWMIGCKLTSGEVKWVKTGVTRLIGRQFAEPTTTTTGA
jgi:hypothetical protein